MSQEAGLAGHVRRPHPLAAKPLLARQSSSRSSNRDGHESDHSAHISVPSADDESDGDGEQNIQSDDGNLSPPDDGSPEEMSETEDEDEASVVNPPVRPKDASLRPPTPPSPERSPEAPVSVVYQNPSGGVLVNVTKTGYHEPSGAARPRTLDARRYQKALQVELQSHALPTVGEASSSDGRSPLPAAAGDVFTAGPSAPLQRQRSRAETPPDKDDELPEEVTDGEDEADGAPSMLIPRQRASRRARPSTAPIPNSEVDQSLAEQHSLQKGSQPFTTSTSPHSGTGVRSVVTLDHDAEVWKEPSFMRSAGKGKSKAEALPVSHKSSASTTARVTTADLSHLPRGFGRHTSSASSSTMRTSSGEGLLPRGMKRLKVEDDDENITKEPNQVDSAARPTKKARTLDVSAARASSSSVGHTKSAPSLLPSRKGDQDPAPPSLSIPMAFVPLEIKDELMEVDVVAPILKLAGWRPSLDLQRTTERPHLISHERLQDIILRTGRHRHKEQQAQKKRQGAGRQ